LILTYPVTVWIRPMKLSSSDAMLSGEKERERERQCERGDRQTERKRYDTGATQTKS